VRRFRPDMEAMGARTSLAEAGKAMVREALPEGIRKAIRRRRPPTLAERMSRYLEPRMQEILGGRRRGGEVGGGMSPSQRGHVARWRSAELAFSNECCDVAAAAHGLEVRHPLRSKAMLEFAMRVPGRLLFAGGWHKALHRRAMEGILPEAVVRRRDKAEFTCADRRCLAQFGEMERRGDLAVWSRWLRPETMERHYQAFMEGGFTDGEPEAHFCSYPFWAALVCGMIAKEDQGEEPEG